MLAFDSNLAPVVGQQITLNPDNSVIAAPRIDLLMQRADAGECELVVRETGEHERGYLYIGSSTFKTDRANQPAVSAGELRARNHDATLTYTCVPPGSGLRMALDRDLDGYYDGD